MQDTGRIIIVGDLFPVPTNFERYSEGDIQYLFGEKIIELFQTADYRICNLEGPLTDGNDKREKTGPALHAPTATVAAVKAIGIDCCTLANNHMTDAGHQGVVDTMATLDKCGIAYIGAGCNRGSIRRSHVFQVAGRHVGLYNVAETMYNEPTVDQAGVWLYDEYIVCKEIEQLKASCDYVIVVYHGGAEHYRYPSPEVKKRFHRMVDSGADMVLSQHTHCVGSEEYYNGAYLLYGQGNFLFRSFNNEFTDTGLILELNFDEDGVKVIRHLVNAIDDTVRYDEKQQLVDFEERSKHIIDDEFLNNEYIKYSNKQFLSFMRSYKGKSFVIKLLGRIFPKSLCPLLMNSYSRTQLLLILHSLRSEQNREMAIAGLKDYLRKH